MTNILFAGRKQIAADVLESLSHVKDINVVGVLTDSHLSGSPTTEVARKSDIPVLSFEDALFLLRDGRLDFDLGVSILYWKKFKYEFLTKPSRGLINFHPAPLPEYKGTAGYNLAILEGRSTWGVSAHYVDEEIDTGDIIKVLGFDIDPERELCTTLEEKSMNYMRVLIDDVLRRALLSETRLNSIPNIGGRYVSRQQMEDMKIVKPGDDVTRKARAFWFPPYDGANITIDGKKFTLIDQTILESLAPAGATSLFTNKS